MRVGIDSYSYHRRYGEQRAGEAPSADAPWPLEPEPGPAPRPGSAARMSCSSRPATCPNPRPSIGTSCAAEAGPVAGRLLVGPSLAGGPVPRARWRPVLRRRAGAGPLDRRRRPHGPRRAAHHRRQPRIPGRRTRRGARRAPGRADAPGRRACRRPRDPPRPREPRRPAGRRHPRPVRRAVDRPGPRRVPGQRQPHPGRRRHGRRDPGAGARTRCWSSSRITWPATRRSGAVRCARPWARACADLDGLIAILAEAGFDGPVCVELASLGPDDVDELAMIERSIAWLREHLPAPAARRLPAEVRLSRRRTAGPPPRRR